VLEFQRVCHGYGDRSVLDAVTFTIESGTTALLGVNGAGKTTLLSLAGGALRPRSGSVRVAGKHLFGGLRERRSGLRDVALMPQTAVFPGGMTACEVVEYITWMRGARSREARIAAEDALARVMLADRAASKVRTLSGGMLRRLCLAQAIASGARVLLLDEPSTGLDPEQRRLMITHLEDLDGAVLLSSHVMEDVRDLADRVLILDGGGIAFDGDVSELERLAPDSAGVRAAEEGFLRVLARSRPSVAS
jgi:ABC-2 type transport system ATP-binding protein